MERDETDKRRQTICVIALKWESERKSIFSAGVKSKSLEMMENKVMWEQFFMCEKLNLTTSMQVSFEKYQYQLPQQICIQIINTACSTLILLIKQKFSLLDIRETIIFSLYSSRVPELEALMINNIVSWIKDKKWPIIEVKRKLLL